MLEIKSMEKYTDGVHVRLNDYADIKTVKCTVANIGDEIIPTGFTFSGSPIFSYDTYKKYLNGNHYARVYVEVEYKVKELELEERLFNTAEGIDNYIVDLETLHHIMNIRSVAYNKKHIKLDEFVWKGILKFDQFGQTMYLFNIEYEDYVLERIKYGTVHASTFGMYCKSWSATFKPIPEQNEVCTECGKSFTLNDINDYDTKREKGFHKDCLKLYNNKKQLEEFKEVFLKIYDLNELKFTETPNKYCSCNHCATWFIVSTPDGDIQIGWRKRVINIVWLDNYKSFTEIFESEDVTKGFSEWDKERFIHAWSIEKAVEYLNKAKNSIS